MFCRNVFQMSKCYKLISLLLVAICYPAYGRVIKAKVVALDQPLMYNRLGSSQPGGMIFALARDVVPTKGSTSQTCAQIKCVAGEVALRPAKRPRPMVLRVNAGDDLQVTFTNLLLPAEPLNGTTPVGATTFTRRAGLHIEGVEWDTVALDDGSFVDANGTSYATPNQTRVYTVHAPAEGAYLLTSLAGPLGGTGAGQTSAGLFGALHVEPKGAKWYRSQVTRCDLSVVQTSSTPDGQPLIADYDKTYPSPSPCADSQFMLPNTPVLGILDSNNEIAHSDLTAMIVGPNGGQFIDDGSPDYFPNSAEPNRLQPFREFTIIYHSDFLATQAFCGAGSPPPGEQPVCNSGALFDSFDAGSDAFGINYGIAGIFAEIYANRLGVGPMGGCTECKFEEFFLSSWTIGDPAMVVDLPANHVNSGTKTIRTGTRVPAVTDPGTQPFEMQPFVKASKALYPDDPSNVYHSYLNDHVRFRILSADSDLHHIHHQHAHQWLHTPNSSDSTYLDSQAIGPGSAFTLDISYEGSGNRNRTIGDSIFHCHFYPHFAQGMWSLWRVHDVFEQGTELDAKGVPVKGSRAQPDGEIVAGTPIPAIVPLPSLPMAPMPSPVFIDNGQVVYGTPAAPDPTGQNVTVNPGYPFFIPGTAGQRPTNPPLGVAKNPDFDPAVTDPSDPRHYPLLDGGLPRHLTGTGTVTEYHTLYNFEKDVHKLKAREIPEDGTTVEKVAIAFNQQGTHASFRPDGAPGNFVTNGLGPQQGAPYADPCLPLDGRLPDTIYYKVAAIQLDVILNKKGWHFPQQRMLSLWGDVIPTIYGDPANGGAQKAPEPLFFRANSGSCIEYWHTNLVPNYYELDNFQVRTPTDIIGQHIHLVKFDVTSSDGAANGWNYEDGTASPGEVQERINAINAGGGLLPPDNAPPGTQPRKLAAVRPYYFCSDPAAAWFSENCASSGAKLGAWVGARTTVERWWADPLLNNPPGPQQPFDRTMRTVFTHDHFSPSTHQQAGLYAGLLIEPASSHWFMPDSKDPNKEIPMDDRVIAHSKSGPVTDGGPTSWQAEVHTNPDSESFREFALEFQDMQLAYLPNSKSKPGPPPGGYNQADTTGLIKFGWYDVKNTIVNPPPTQPPASTLEHCCAWPQIVSEGFQLGTYSLNYRNEPIPFRVWDPVVGKQAAGDQGDLSSAFRSINRADACLIQQPAFPATLGMFAKPKLTCTGTPTADPRKYPAPLQPANDAGVQATDPFTPLLRAYQNDKVQVRILVGSHLATHDFSVPGMRWLYEPSDKNSGFRNDQVMGISEHFEYLLTMPPSKGTGGVTDYPYLADGSDLGMQHGIWGLLRSYDGTAGKQPALPFLPSNPSGTAGASAVTACPAGAPKRTYTVHAITADQLPFHKLLYNTRFNLYNNNALVYVLDQDLAGMKSGAVPVQPLVLRANAGDCMEVTLINDFTPSAAVFQPANSVGAFGVLGPINHTIFNTKGLFSYNIQTTTSSQAGLSPQLVTADVTNNLGMNAGVNALQTACAKGTTCTQNQVTYEWYAGALYDPWTGEAGSGAFHPHPVEFGAANLSASDPSQQPFQGLFGALVIEPAGSKWILDANSTVSATVKPDSGAPFDAFREFVAITSDNVGQDITVNKALVPFNYESAVDYGAEPWVLRLGNNPALKARAFNNFDLSCGLSDKLVTTFPAGQVPATQPVGEFETPVFVASAGSPVRLRVLSPAGGSNDQIFEVHGHNWQEEPYTADSTKLGFNPLSSAQGSRMGHGSRNHFDILIPSAGGANKIAGDYLYRTHAALAFRGGLFGTFRVGAPGKDTVSLTAQQGTGSVTIFGSDTVQPSTGQYATSVQVFNGPAKPDGSGCTGSLITTVTTIKNGAWTVKTTAKQVCAISNLGGVGSLDMTTSFPVPCTNITQSYGPAEGPTKLPAVSATPTAKDLQAEQKEKLLQKPDRFHDQP